MPNPNYLTKLNIAFDFNKLRNENFEATESCINDFLKEVDVDEQLKKLSVFK